MGAKKRTEGGKAITDESAEQLYRAYRRNLVEWGLTMPKFLEDKFFEIRDEKNPGFLTELVFWEFLGADGTRALADALRDTNYMHLRTIRCWRASTEDEGTRSICQYLRNTPSILTLELLECGLTSLSCEFLGRLLSPEANNGLLILKIDHNDIGNTGVRNIVQGLSMNSVLKTLTMSYCNFDEQAARPLMTVLIFQESGLQELDLQGNKLGNQGTCILLHSLKINQSLNKINLADNQIIANEAIVDKIIEMLTANSALFSIDFRLNSFQDNEVQDILDRMKNSASGRINQTLYDMILPENTVSAIWVDEINKFLLPNKKSKKGKKKAKKAKK